jgi:hypothetical protein
MPKPLPTLILDELAARCATLAARADSPWHGTAIQVIRDRPREDVSAKHGLVVIEPQPIAVAANVQNQLGYATWRLDVNVGAFIEQSELAPESGPDTRLSADDLGIAGVAEIVYAVNPETLFAGQGFLQLCATVTVLQGSFGNNSEGSGFGASVGLQFTFETDARDMRVHRYAPTP